MLFRYSYAAKELQINSQLTDYYYIIIYRFRICSFLAVFRYFPARSSPLT